MPVPLLSCWRLRTLRRRSCGGARRYQRHPSATCSCSDIAPRAHYAAANGHFVTRYCRARPSWAIEQYENTREARNGLLRFPRGIRSITSGPLSMSDATGGRAAQSITPALDRSSAGGPRDPSQISGKDHEARQCHRTSCYPQNATARDFAHLPDDKPEANPQEMQGGRRQHKRCPVLKP
jgi:hypothetical protein